MKRIVLFDGECNFCNSSVQFIIKRDPAAHFLFSSLQSETGEKYVKQYNVPDDVDSLVLIENGKAYTKSSAALHIAKKLDGLWHLLFYLYSSHAKFVTAFMTILRATVIAGSAKPKERADFLPLRKGNDLFNDIPVLLLL